MAMNEKKRAEGRKQYIEGASAHDFPNFTEPPQEELREYSKTKQEQLRQELDAQVDANKQIAENAKRKERSLECGQNEATQQEIQRLRLEQKVKKEQEREQLQQHWDRDVRLNKIKKAIEGHHTKPVPLPMDMRSAVGSDKHLSFDGPPLSARSGPSSDRGGMRVPARRTPLSAAGSLALQRERLSSGLSY